MLTSKRKATPEEAEVMVRPIDGAQHVEETQTDLSTRVRAALLGARIWHVGSEITIDELASAAAATPTDGLGTDREAANSI